MIRCVVALSPSRLGESECHGRGKWFSRGSALVGAANATITNSGSVTFHDTSTAANAAITIASGGILFFNDSSTAGNSTININTLPFLGSLQFSNTSTAGNATITITGEALFVDSSTAGNATITNNGGLFFENSATAGNAVITANSGTFTQFFDSSTAGNATITTNNGALTQFFDTSTGGNARFITNAGGTFDISGLTSSGMTAGSIEGAGSYFLGSKALTVGSNNLSTTVSGVIADGGSGGGGTGGSLVKVGTGTLILSGTDTYTGATSVNAGVLEVTGSLVSAVTVNSGGTLTGGGTIGGLTVTSGGIVAPGLGIGTLSVSGNVAFAAGSIYQVEVNAAGQSDKIAATGTATLSGGTVQVLAAAGSYAPSTNYTILTATGGVTGTFSNVTSNFAFLVPSLSYDANDVFLTLQRNSTMLQSIAQTPNERAVAGALDQGPPTSPLVQAVLFQSNAGALQAFNALSGEIHASVATALTEDSRFVRNAVMGRLSSASYSTGAGGTVALAAASPDQMMGLTRSPTPMGYGSKPSDYTFWTQGFGAWGKWESDGNAAAMSRNIGGVFAGVDSPISNSSRFGFVTGYSHSDLSVGDRASSAEVDTIHAAAYVGTQLGALKLRSSAAFAWHDIDTSRSIIFPGFFETARASYHGSTTQVFGEAGYGMAFGKIALEPFVGAAWVHQQTGSFTEAGGTPAAVAPLVGGGDSENVGYSTVGIRAATKMVLANGIIVTPRVAVDWQHAFGDITPTAALAFQSTGAPFTIFGLPLARDSAQAEAGLDVKFAPTGSLRFSYVGQIGEKMQNSAVNGRLSWTW